MRVKFHGKEFELSYSFEQIQEAIRKIAQQINKDYQGQRPMFICILNGSFMFAADLCKELNIEAEISFLKLATYSGTSSSGKIKKLIGLNEELKGRSVIILEDIVDTGFTINEVIKQVHEHHPAKIKVATLLFKPDALKIPIHLDYIGLEIPNEFIVGYGLDFDGLGRNLRDIYTLIDP